MNTKSNSRSRKSRIFTTRITFIALAAFALLTLAATSALMANFAGAIFTTNSVCDGTDLNIYASKADVYVDGGPAHEGAAGLPNDADTPDGGYYVQVTTPSGDVLGKSAGVVVHVANNEFVVCYQLIDIVYSTSSGFTTKGFDDTDNPGGEYKVWVSTVPTFANDNSKTDNFKVQEGDVTPPQGLLKVIKFYDSNANGSNDGEPEIVGWEVQVGDQAGFPLTAETKLTPVSIVVAPGCYTAQEGDATGWIHTTAKIDSKAVTADGTTTISFGNVCLGPGGGLTLGFWSNRNGQALFGADDLALMVSLNLRNANGTAFDPASYSAFRTWLLSANATNMAYMLSAQLAAMELNVLNGKVSGGSLVYAPCLIGVPGGANAAGFISVNALMTLANTSLGTDGYTVAAGATRDYQECLKTTLDKANNNLNFLQGPGACPVPETFTYTDESAPACP
jgi:hypothetical protein